MDCILFTVDDRIHQTILHSMLPSTSCITTMCGRSYTFSTAFTLHNNRGLEPTFNTTRGFLAEGDLGL